MRSCVAVYIFMKAASCFTYLNLALNGKAFQSGQFSKYGASKATDGNKEQRWDGGSCSHTAIPRTTAWWMLDIGNEAYIDSVKYFYRIDKPYRLDGFRLYISKNFSVTDPARGTLCFNDTYGFPWPDTIQDLRCNTTGRFVVFYKERNFSDTRYSFYDDAILELCEVEVFGCPLGKYGDKCSNVCPMNCVSTYCNIQTGFCDCIAGYQGMSCSEPCNRGTFGMRCKEECGKCYGSCLPTNGTCKNGCQSGWKGDTCKTSCDHGTFGMKCQERCHCRDGEACNNANGICPSRLCKAGWKLESCSKECDHGTFGMKCQERCHCKDGAVCNHVNGICPSRLCKAGWKLESCSKVCDPGTFGNQCLNRCHCEGGAACNHVSGRCLGGKCEAGWRLNSCSELCDPGTFGRQCRKRCHCERKAACHHVNGSCFNGKCEAGWKLDSCSEMCDHGTFGMKCQERCHCRGRAACNHVFGSCPSGLCEAGWKLESCSQRCDHGTFGVDCQTQCHCRDGVPCNHVNGSCSNGQCKAGWKLDSCSAVCDHGTFGMKCQERCHCRGGAACNHVFGSCPSGLCEVGWKLESCSQRCDHGTFGEDCQTQCHCRDGVQCNHVNGSCLNGQCKAGWKLDSCSAECDHGTFGIQCRDRCFCKDGAACNPINGSCPNYLCKAGWKLDSCSEECEQGTYGPNCRLSCQNCKFELCNKVNGECDPPGECKPGYKGSNCNQAKGDLGTTIGAVISILILIFLLIGGGYIIYRRKRKERGTGSKYHSATTPTSTSNTACREDKNFKNRAFDGQKYVNFEIGSSLKSGSQKPVSSDRDVQKSNVMEHEFDLMYCNAESTSNESKFKISVDKLASIVAIKKRNGELEKEYCTLPNGSQYPNKEAEKNENKPKNRYLTTFPYDHSRVKLKQFTDNDYINANYIRSYSNNRAYIATQGPKRNTLIEFWQMIWQENVGKIVMVTKLMEGDKKKCEQYWPRSTKATSVIGNFTLKMTMEREHTVYVHRCIEVTHGEVRSTRKIDHFHFTQWPDHGVPDTTKLLNFYRKVTSTINKLPGPLVVHCSAGIGRTGTYIALDALYENGLKTGFVNIKEFTEMMRNDRMNMIQTAAQYTVVHEALAEAFSLQSTSIEINTFGEMVDSLNIRLSNVTIDKEYKTLTSLKSNLGGKFKAGKKPENIPKNAVQNILPDDDYRPFIMSYGRARNDYINAVLIPSFKPDMNFIATHHPLKETVGDFWSLVYDHDCKTIVLLEEIHGIQFLPEESGHDKIYDNFIVSKRSSISKDKTTVSLRHKDTEEIRCITILMGNEWLDDKMLPSSEKETVEFVGKVMNSIKQNPRSTVIVVCRDGCRRCGVFLTLSLAIQKIEMDDEIDIFQVARVLQVRRREFLANVDQYEFCYWCIEEYCNPAENLYLNV